MYAPVSLARVITRNQLVCLNPYSNGILSDLKEGTLSITDFDVLILILMEYSLTIYQRAVYDFCTLIYSFCC